MIGKQAGHARRGATPGWWVLSENNTGPGWLLCNPGMPLCPAVDERLRIAWVASQQRAILFPPSALGKLECENLMI